jgi:DNA-binding SARP family transcriptional activator
LLIELLCHFRAAADGLLLTFGRAGERLVAYVALEDRSRTRDQIAGALWPDASQARAAASLRRALSIVRRRAPGLLRCDGHRLSIAPAVSVDVRLQRTLIDRITGGEQGAVDVSHLRLLRGDLLPDWDEPWLVAVRHELRQLRLLSLEAVASAHLDQSRPGNALAVALSAAREEPLRESAHRLVVRAHLAQGNTVEAARQYSYYRRLLWTELHLRPGAYMEALMEPVLRDAALAH